MNKVLCGKLKSRRMLIMGILNITPDSFYDGGKYKDVHTAVEHAGTLIDAGADIIDIGGESSRPGSLPVDVQLEIDRVVPVVREIGLRYDIPISVDTTKSVVARESLDSGAAIINDISAFTADPAMIEVLSRYDVPVILMHMQGTPVTMQKNPSYAGWVVDEICAFFEERIVFSESNGISRDRIIIDPGIGFGKTVDHNLDIIANCKEFKRFRLPVLIGHSNKRFIGAVTGVETLEERLWGTVAVAAFLQLLGGVDIIRVHNVAEIKIVTRMIEALQNKMQ
ncbi:MAG: dihydropteroate synthase [Candidatus Auribacterota bacterium]|jgi:dihydropteroate synthase|nr:dihydropteroate synthase [Candidatus Auribacterota bacterium]